RAVHPAHWDQVQEKDGASCDVVPIVRPEAARRAVLFLDLVPVSRMLQPIDRMGMNERLQWGRQHERWGGKSDACASTATVILRTGRSFVPKRAALEKNACLRRARGYHA